MKIIGVIPARYASSRFPGKPLADIHGKPMVWWVYQQAKKVASFNSVVVATDNQQIFDTCQNYSISVVMTSADCPTPANRIHEISCKIDADLYVEINGDEPLIEPKTIESVIPSKIADTQPYVGSLYSIITDAIDVIDPTNLKVIIDHNSRSVYISRAPIPFPKGSLNFTYKKYIGIVAFNKSALDFYTATPRGEIEIAEDMDLLRFIENGIPVHFNEVNCKTISVDTEKDLIKVRNILSSREN
jgi:3-deoxy-manno-octulosonate cytidylyltransferase (CMP-KDO synthetase)